MNSAICYPSGIQCFDALLVDLYNLSSAMPDANMLYPIYSFERYLHYSIDPTKIKMQDTARIIASVAMYNPLGRQLAWQFVQLHWAHILELKK